METSKSVEGINILLQPSVLLCGLENIQSTFHIDSRAQQKGKPGLPLKRGYDYSSGVWKFEGEAYISSGTTATTPVVLSNAYNRWFKVNVIHDVGVSNLKVYIDSALRYEGFGAGGSNHYFKFGVYAEEGASI
ncbi:hypothetical protein V6N13_076608 [Hibiscus sabdariffa]